MLNGLIFLVMFYRGAMDSCQRGSQKYYYYLEILLLQAFRNHWLEGEQLKHKISSVLFLVC